MSELKDLKRKVRRQNSIAVSIAEGFINVVEGLFKVVVVIILLTWRK